MQRVVAGDGQSGWLGGRVFSGCSRREDSVATVYQHPVDPKDTMVVNLAVAVGAHVITSRDRHLLSLRDVGTPAGADFMARFRHIEVLTPVELLDRLRGGRK